MGTNSPWSSQKNDETIFVCICRKFSKMFWIKIRRIRRWISGVSGGIDIFELCFTKQICENSSKNFSSIIIKRLVPNILTQIWLSSKDFHHELNMRRIWQNSNSCFASIFWKKWAKNSLWNSEKRTRNSSRNFLGN